MRTLFLCLFFAAQAYSAVEDFSAHLSSAANSKLSMSQRWVSLIKAAKAASADELTQIKKFSESKEWFMRNAALVALNKVDKSAAMIEAKRLIYDRSLVVRSAAVEIISSNLSEENKNILSVEMSKAYNFHKTSSLWIRKQIVEKLSIAASLADRDFFVRGLFDSDKEIAKMSAKMLSKITGQPVEDTGYVEKWQAKAKQNNWL